MSKKQGKTARQKAKARRDAAKKARRSANYLRCGPKRGQTVKKKSNRFKPGKARSEPIKLERKKGKAKLSERQREHGRSNSKKRPLAPLRKRRRMSAKDIRNRRQTAAIKDQLLESWHLTS